MYLCDQAVYYKMREDGWHVQAKVRKVLALHTVRKHHLEISVGIDVIG